MTLNDEFAFKRLLDRIDDPNNRSVLVILENADGSLDTAYQGTEGTPGMFALAFSVASQCGDEVLQQFTPEQRAGFRLVYPTQDQARELGLLGPSARTRLVDFKKKNGRR